MSDPIVDVQSLRRSFLDPRQRCAFEVFVESLSITAGARIVVSGHSGSGKTTLLHLIAGLDRPSSGVVRCFGDDLASMSDAALALWRRRRLGFVYQNPAFVDYLTICQNVTIRLVPEGISQGVRRGRAERLLERLGVAHVIDRRPRELSTGEQQRASMARALVCEPSLLICDEPTSNLDAQSRDLIIDMLDELRARMVTQVIVSHDPAFFQIADASYVMSRGGLQRHD